MREMRGHVLLLLVLSFVWCVKSLSFHTKKHTTSHTWSGEWGVHVAPGVDPEFLSNLGFTVVKKIGNLQDAYLVRHSQITPQHPSHQIEAVHASLQNHESVIFTDKMLKKTMTKKKNVVFVPGDPLYPNQWHLNNTGQQGGTPGQDINITGVWNLGYSGKGVRIAIVDDGYEYLHPDLIPGYHPESSFNINGDNPDPAPGEYDWHGTSAAGVALAANNSACGVGAAYAAEGSGIRLIADAFSDADTAAALHFMNNVNYIYSNSWGPADDGETLEGPGYFTLAALEDGIENGRGGKGSIFVWAAGNGLQYNDNCNYDGFANHRATIAVGAVGADGKQSYYSEPCAAMLVTAPSSSRISGITTTDIMGENGYDLSDCTADFGGTSSACPLVAGVIALLLEANPSLTWRDVQFILLSTADKNDPTDPDWVVNGAGYHINHKYGFGRVNVWAAVQAANDFDNLHSAKSATYSHVITNNTITPNDTYAGVNRTIHIKQSSLIVEHVEVTVNIPNFFNAGDLLVVLTSPAGTKSVLAEKHGDGYGIFLNIPAYPLADYACGPALFGPQLTLEPISGDVVIPQPSSFGCNTITNCADLQGKIVLVDISPVCNATDQVFNAQQCGAILVLVSNRFVGPPSYLPDDYPTKYNITIPSAMIPYEAGLLLKDELEFVGNVTVSVGVEYYKANLSYDGWTFSTVRNWGEKAQGVWTLEVIDSLTGAEAPYASWDLTIYGHSKPFQLQPWIVGIIVAALVVFVFVVATALYIRNKNKGGYSRMP